MTRHDDHYRNLPWATWPWQKCIAVTIDAYGRCRCDLKHGHKEDHRAERGMYDVVWPQEMRFEA